MARVSPVAIRETAGVFLSAAGGRSVVAQAAALSDSGRANRRSDAVVFVSTKTGRTRSPNHAACRMSIRRGSCKRACKFTAASPIGCCSTLKNCSTACRRAAATTQRAANSTRSSLPKRAQEELGYYQQRCADFSATVSVRDDMYAGLMVSGDQLLLAAARASRGDASMHCCSTKLART